MNMNALSPERIRLHVDEPTKKRTLEIVTELCAPEAMRSNFFQALIDREKLGTTGLGHGVALPHARISGLDKPLACFLQLKKPIPFEAPDDEPVDLVVGLFVPEEDNDTHLKLLSDIATVLNNESVRKALRETSSPDDAFEVLSQAKGDAALAS